MTRDTTSLAAIAAALTARGVPSPSGRGGWCAAAARRVLARSMACDGQFELLQQVLANRRILAQSGERGPWMMCPGPFGTVPASIWRVEYRPASMTKAGDSGNAFTRSSTRIPTMADPERRFGRTMTARTAALAFVLAATTAITPTAATAGEAEAKALLKAMTDYVTAQKAISFDYDVSLEVVTKDGQKLTLAASGNLELARPDKLRASRSGGFADIETVFDGKTLTILGKNLNVYTQVAIPGSIDHLVDELREKYNRPLPGADLLISNSYDELMEDVVDVKDLGSGVIGGTECDHLAFRKKDVDWQIWIAQGARPYPCRYDVTTKVIAGNPAYSIQIRDWKAGGEVASKDFGFTAPAGARQVDVADLAKLKDMSDLPSNFRIGDK